MPWIAPDFEARERKRKRAGWRGIPKGTGMLTIWARADHAHIQFMPGGNADDPVRAGRVRLDVDDADHWLGINAHDDETKD